MFKICRLEWNHLFAVAIFVAIILPNSIQSYSYLSTELTKNHYSNNQDANYHHQMITEHPSDLKAKIGDRVLLKCRILNLRGEPQWCIDDFCLGIAKPNKSVNDPENENTYALTSSEQHLKGRPRYRITGDRAKGEFNLLIEPVQLQDNMKYYCMATAASETVKAVKSKKAFLTVLSNFFEFFKNFV